MEDQPTAPVHAGPRVASYKFASPTRSVGSRVDGVQVVAPYPLATQAGQVWEGWGRGAHRMLTRMCVRELLAYCQTMGGGGAVCGSVGGEGRRQPSSPPPPYRGLPSRTHNTTLT